MNTTLMLIDYGEKLGEAFPETLPGYTLDDALSSILSGEPLGTLRAVYSIANGKCEDVSSLVADRIIDALCRGDFVSPMARDFANYCSKEMQMEAA